MTPFRGKLRARHLEVILSISEQGNLSRSAELLHMTQSGLSRALTEIEEIVEAKLFERTPKGMTPTPTGRAMCHYSSRLLGEMRKAQAELESIASGAEGSLAIGCFSMFSGLPFAKAVEQFALQFPNIQITIEVGPHETLIEKLDSGSIDILISRGGRTIHGGIHRVIDLLDDGSVLACSPRHPLASMQPTLDDCVKYPWITAPPGSIMRQLVVQEILARGASVPNIIGALSLELGRSLVQGGQMLWHLPKSMAQFMSAQGEICILPVQLRLDPGPLSAIWRRDRSSTRAMRNFTLLLTESLRTDATLPPH